MHELLARQERGLIVQLHQTESGGGYRRIDHPEEEIGVAPALALHVPVILRGIPEKLIQQLPLPFEHRSHNLAWIALLRGLNNAQVPLVKIRMLRRQMKIKTRDLFQPHRNVSVVTGRLFKRFPERIEIRSEKRLQKAALAAEIMIKGRLGNAGCIHDLLDARILVAFAPEQVQRLFQDDVPRAAHTRNILIGKYEQVKWSGIFGQESGPGQGDDRIHGPEVLKRR